MAKRNGKTTKTRRTFDDEFKEQAVHTANRGDTPTFATFVIYWATNGLMSSANAMIAHVGLSP